MSRTKKTKFKRYLLRVLHKIVPQWANIYKVISPEQAASLIVELENKLESFGDISTWQDKQDDDNGESLADAILTLARLIALQSFQDGGVTYLGYSWRNRRSNHE